MNKEDLKNINFLDWNEFYKKDLNNYIINEFHKYINNYDLNPKDILFTGSRVVKINGKSYFNDDSDLDVIIILKINNYIKYFGIDYYISHFTTETLRDFGYDAPKKEYLIPKISNVYYADIKISVFIYSDIYSNERYTYFYNKWQFPYYSVMNGYYYEGNINDVIDYYLYNKVRIDKQKFCYVCKKEKDTIGYITIHFQSNDNHKINTISICKDCYEKYFKNILSNK